MLSVAASLPAPATTFQRLSEISGELPYQLTSAVAEGGEAHLAAAVDLDGDGSDEVIASRVGRRGAPYYITPFYVRPEGPGALAQINNENPAALAGVFDVDGDGRPEVVWWRVTDEKELVLEILKMWIQEDEDKVSWKTMGRLSWDVGEFSYGAATWDGSIHAAGVVDRDGDGKTESIVFAICASMSRVPRGIGVGDWEAGEVEWFLPYGPPPCHEELVDVDGVPGPEIVVAFGAPCNLATAGGLTDTSAYVAAFSIRGERLWMHQAGEASSMPVIAHGDLNGDGKMEIAHGLYGGRDSGSRWWALTLRQGASGEEMAVWRHESQPCAVAVARTDDRDRVYVGSADGLVRRFVLDEGGLRPDREARLGPPILALKEIELSLGRETAVGEPRNVIVAVSTDGAVGIFDTGLGPLAACEIGEGIGGFDAIDEIALDGGRRGAMITTREAIHFLALERSPVSLWPWFVLGGIAFAVTGVSVPRWRLTVLSEVRRFVTPPSDREAAAQELFSALQTASHGELAVMTTLRRLRGRVAAAAGLDGDAADVLAAQYARAVRDVEEVGLPKIEAIARGSVRAALEPVSAASLRREHRRARDLVASLSENLPSPEDADGLARSLDGVMSRLNESLERIGESCTFQLSSVLTLEIRRVIEARRPQMIEEGVELVSPAVSSLEGARVFGTPSEVSFILDNLIANAIAAVAGGQERRIEISVDSQNSDAVVLVRDTGVGIPPAEQERIFEPGFTTRPGGGHGLSKSRELLQTRGGAIRLASSAPGRGSVFEVRLRRCTDKGRQ